MEKEIHKGHRKRVKARFLKEGLDGFEDHQALELLLFYCYPMKDTNEIAHKMINAFGSLSALFDAHPLDIKDKCGCTENVAVLISLIPELAKRYTQLKWADRPLLDSSKKVGSFALSLYLNDPNECFFIICLDNQRHLIKAVKISEGTIDEAPVYPRKIVEECVRYKAASVVLSHNHPSGSLAASRSDIEATKKIKSALDTIEVDVLDHIIVASGKYLSFAEKKLLRFFY